MTGDCDICQASTPLHTMTAFRKAGREEHRAKYLLMCPRCYAAWWHAEEVAAVSLEAHYPGPGGHGRTCRLGLKSRRKGQARERELAKLLGGERIPLSGAAGGSFGSDVLWRNLKIEVKARAGTSGTGYSLLYRWLEGADLLAVRNDQHEWLIVVPLARFLALVGEG